MVEEQEKVISGEEFEKTLRLLKKLKEDNQIFASLIPPFEISFEIDKESLNKYLKEFDLKSDDFQRKQGLISYMLLAILIRDEERFINSNIKNSLSKEKIKKEDVELEKKVFKQQFEEIRKSLYDVKLQKRYDFKASSKAPSFSSIDWDIKIKVKDAELEEIKFPYATCRIIYQREYTDSLPNFLGGRIFDSVQLNFSLEEIKYLSRVLETVKKNLEETEGKKDDIS